jgi:hypothetical protein
VLKSVGRVSTYFMVRLGFWEMGGLPVGDLRLHGFDAFERWAEGVLGIYVCGEDLVEEGPVFGVEGDAVFGDCVLDLDVVEWTVVYCNAWHDCRRARMEGTL